MNFGRFSIEKKYVILAFIIGIFIIGLYARFTMNTQLSPDTTPPMVTVMAIYPGAPAKDVAADVSEPMEKDLAKLDGIIDIQSTSQDNISIIRLTFDYSTNIDQAAIDIQNTISRIRDTLPSGLNEPQVLKFNTSDQPIMTIGLKSDSLDMPTLRRLAEDKLVYDLQLVEGVAATDLFGGYHQEIRISLDPFKIKAYQLTPEQVALALKADNIRAPGGTILHGDNELLLRIEESLTNVEELKNKLIPLTDGSTVALGNISEVYSGIEKRESAYHLNGEEALALLITKKSDYNTVDVVNHISEKLEEMRTEYPFVEMTIASDDSVFTTQMVDNMSASVVIAILFTILIIFLFISNVSRSLVISISMPLVFLSTLALMKLFGMSLDLVTLSALILSIGFVVDASIVVMENISRHKSLGKTITMAAIDGTQEIALPSIAGAATTIIVLLPLLFIKGFVGEMFRPLSMTLIFAILSSLAIALFAIPLLSVMLEPLKLRKTEKKLSVLTFPFNRSMDWLLVKYLKLSNIVLHHKILTFTVLFVLLAAGGLFISANGIEMLPKFDSGVTFATVEMKPGTTLNNTSEAISTIEEFLSDEPGVLNYDARIGYEEGNSQMGDFGIMGADQAMLSITLESRKERDEDIWTFQERLRRIIEDIPGVNRFVVKEKGGTAVTGTSAPIALKVSGENLDVLYHLGALLSEKIAAVEGTTNLFKSYNDKYLQMSISLDERRLKELRLSSSNVAGQLYAAMEGIKSGSMNLNNDKLLDIRVHYAGNTEATLKNFMETDLTTPAGIKVPFKEVASAKLSPRSNLIERDNMEYSVKIFGFTEGRAFSHVVRDIEEIAGTVPLPKGYTISFSGEQETLTDSIGDMASLLVLSIVLIYLLLVTQFKSFVHPLTIILSIPLVIIGVAPALGLTGKYISMPVLLGFILLAGTVVNNAILLVDAIYSNRESGATLNQAIEESIKSRFRPIMMTAVSDVVGMMPLALQLALGSERFSPLAITVIGGILAATFLTIVVIPLIYACFEEAKDKLSGLKVQKIYRET